MRRLAARSYLPLLLTLLFGLAACSVSYGMSSALLQRDRAALAARIPGERGDAAVQLAETFNEAEDGAGAQAAADAALRASLAHPEAVRVLALNAERGGRAPLAAAMMAVAARWGWRDTPTQVWLLRNALKTGDVENMFKHADGLIRRQRFRPEMFALFTRAAVASPELLAAALPHLEGRPKWRPAFFSPDANPATGAPGFETLVRRLGAGSAPPTREELEPYVGRLLQTHEYSRAGRLWADLFPGDVAVLDAAGEADLAWPARVDNAASGPFGWRFPESGAAAEIVQRDGARELAADPFGRPNEAAASRTLLLPPGRYLLSAARGDAPPVGWRLRCLPGDKPVDLLRQEGTTLWRLDMSQPCPAWNLEMTLRSAGQSLRIPPFRIRRDG